MRMGTKLRDEMAAMRRRIAELEVSEAQLRQAQEDLRQSEVFFRLIAEHAQDIIYRIRLWPDRRFEYVSPAATRIVGYTPEEHYADPDLGFKLVHPDDVPKLMAAMQQGAQGDAPLLLRWVRKDGVAIWTEQRNVLIMDAEGRPVALEGIARDVTERIQAEQERERLIAELREALNNVKTLRGLLPICASCKKIRNDEGYWLAVEEYMLAHTEARFSHGICPDCLQRLYPDLVDDLNATENERHG